MCSEPQSYLINTKYDSESQTPYDNLMLIEKNPKIQEMAIDYLFQILQENNETGINKGFLEYLSGILEPIWDEPLMKTENNHLKMLP